MISVSLNIQDAAVKMVDSSKRSAGMPVLEKQKKKKEVQVVLRRLVGSRKNMARSSLITITVPIE